MFWGCTLGLVASAVLPVRGQTGPDAGSRTERRTSPTAGAPEAAGPAGPPAAYGPPRHEEPSESESVGASNSGRLDHGVSLPSSDRIHVRNDTNRYGTQELVDLLVWAEERVNAEAPGSRLLVGDLSKRRGRRLRPHASHRVGRDVDVGFYLHDARGAPALNDHFVRLQRTGVGVERRSERELKWDDERNWLLIAAILGQDVVPVQYVMVIEPLHARLLEEGRRRGAPQWLLDRITEAAGPRRTGRGRFARYGTHDSHFHVRIYCDANDSRCRDKPPFWDWIQQPAPEPTTARRRRSRSSMRPSMRSSMRPSMRSSMRPSMRSSMAVSMSASRMRTSMR